MHYELFKKFNSEYRYKQQEYSQTCEAISTHPHLASASLDQILFCLEKKFPYINKKVIHNMADKGICSYPEIKSLPLKEYTSLLCAAILYRCDGVCKDLMQLEQYTHFLPHKSYLEMVISESLTAKNLFVFESLMNHPSFALLHPSELRDYIDRVKNFVDHGLDKWKPILLNLTIIAENQSKKDKGNLS